MPFKGDLRLGGPHDNEANLNGSSDGPSVPTYGTLLSTENNVLWSYANGGPSFSYDPQGTGVTEYSSSKVTVDIRADGIGGQFYDWSNTRNQTYIPYGTVFNYSYASGNTYVTVSGQTHQSGTFTTNHVHDGYGSWTAIDSYSYFSGYFLTVYDAPYHTTYYGNDYVVGEVDIDYSHNGSGGTTSQVVNPQYYAYGTYVGTRTQNLYIYIDGNSYQSGTSIYDIYSDGNGNAYDSGAAQSTTYVSSGTFIDTIGGNNYYHDGSGYWYISNNPSYGSSTGNSNGGTNYIDINGTQYENGSYSSTEYHDGNGGTYWESSSSYQPYGYTFTSTSSSYWDEYGNESTYTTYYKSDGNGSYYTE